jgi:RNA polymerase sigma-70 factor (ECF subfamily)
MDWKKGGSIMHFESYGVTRQQNIGAGFTEADPDLILVQKARANDPSAVTVLWKRYQARLCSYFLKNVRQREEAEDLASETLLAALAQLPDFRGKGGDETGDDPEKRSSFQTYLYAIARYKLSGWIRRKKKGICASFTELNNREAKTGENLEDCLGADQEADPLNLLLQREQRAQALEAFSDVQRRSANQWMALRYHYIRDMSHKEIAAHLDLPEKTINSRLQEGRRSMRRYCDAINQMRSS